MNDEDDKTGPSASSSSSSSFSSCYLCPPDFSLIRFQRRKKQTSTEGDPPNSPEKQIEKEYWTKNRGTVSGDFLRQIH